MKIARKHCTTSLSTKTTLKKVEEAQKCVAALDVDQDGDFPKTYVITWECIERNVDVLM